MKAEPSRLIPLEPIENVQLFIINTIQVIYMILYKKIKICAFLSHKRYYAFTYIEFQERRRKDNNFYVLYKRATVVLTAV